MKSGKGPIYKKIRICVLEQTNDPSSLVCYLLLGLNVQAIEGGTETI